MAPVGGPRRFEGGPSFAFNRAVKKAYNSRRRERESQVEFVQRSTTAASRPLVRPVGWQTDSQGGSLRQLEQRKASEKASKQASSKSVRSKSAIGWPTRQTKFYAYLNITQTKLRIKHTPTTAVEAAEAAAAAAELNEGMMLRRYLPTTDSPLCI